MTTQQVLPAEPSSAAVARRLARDVLHEWDEDGAIDVVSLLVSELVTNAVLHAGSPVNLRFGRAGHRIRVEIADASSVLPSRPNYGIEAQTGRGLGMVDTLTSDWGVDLQPGEGKVVWFEVPATHEVHLDTDDLVVETTTPGPRDDDWVIRLLSVPVQLFRAMQQHTDALLREYTLMALGSGARPLTHLDIDRTAVPIQLQSALEHGNATVDLVVSAPAEARETLVQVHRALSEADEMAIAGQLLTGPALPEIRALRNWMLDQLRDQLDGLPPVRWSPPEVSEDLVSVAADLSDALEHLATAVVVADDENHVAYANPAAERLLGWNSGELAGSRLTAIIPQRLHEAHLSGYSRYLVTGEPRLMGHPARVPARRRDGSEVEIELVLNAYRHSGGRRMFVAALQQPAPAVSDERLRTWIAAVDAALRIGSNAGSLTDIAEPALQLACEQLGADVAALWLLKGDDLACAAVQERKPGHHDAFVRATRTMLLRRGEGLPGRVWDRGSPIELRDLVADANFPRAMVALESGLRSGVATPVIRDGTVVGVLEMYGSEPLAADPKLTDLLASFGRALGLAGRIA